MKKYETVVFDLDGTLLNTLEDLADATNHALRTMQMPERTIGEVFIRWKRCASSDGTFRSGRI